MTLQHTNSQRLHEQLSAAIDLKEAASHVSTAEKEEVRAVEHALEDVFESPRPRHDTLEKLISLKGSFKAAHLDMPEDELWRDEVDQAMK